MGAGFDRDTAVGMVGAVVLIAAMSGVFFYERNQFDTYEVSWEVREAAAASQSGSLDEEGADSYAFVAEAQRISTVRASLSWTDEDGEPDTFAVTVEGPEGEHTETKEASSSPLEIDVPIAEAPGVETAAARTLEDAREQLNASASWTDGSGEWSVRVELVDAPGRQVGGQETMEDGSQDYQLDFVVERWEPVLG